MTVTLGAVSKMVLSSMVSVQVDPALSPLYQALFFIGLSGVGLGIVWTNKSKSSSRRKVLGKKKHSDIEQFNKKIQSGRNLRNYKRPRRENESKEWGR